MSRDSQNRIFVGNLSFATTADELQIAAEKFGSTVWARVCVDLTDPDRPSRGFGFIEAKTELDAEAIVARLHGFELDGRALHVDWSLPNPG